LACITGHGYFYSVPGPFGFVNLRRLTRRRSLTKFPSGTHATYGGKPFFEAALDANLKVGLHYWSWLLLFSAGAIWFCEFTPLDAVQEFNQVPFGNPCHLRWQPFFEAALDANLRVGLS